MNKTSVDLNIDMIGRVGSEYVGKKDSADYIYVVGDDKLSSDLTPITEQVNSTYSKLKLDRKYNDPKDPEENLFSAVIITILLIKVFPSFFISMAYTPIITVLPIHRIK
ncbi:MAG: hypothetical protein WDN26_08170 [Chitinophagaceae bacterium]